MMNLRERILKLNYPDNHMFDPETMEPTGVLTKRIELLKVNAPELFENGDSLLDIGCNKGFLEYALCKHYNFILGIEPAKEIYDFAQDLKEYHKLDNVRFLHGSFNDLELFQFDVIYVGNVHHYLYNNDVKAKNKPFEFLRTLKEMTGKTLILDGNFEITDFAINAMANEHDWNFKYRNAFTFNSFKKILFPEFKFIRIGYNGIGEKNSSRYTAIWTRK